MTRFKTEPTPEIDSGLIKVGHLVSFWDNRTQSNRRGTIEKITKKYYFIRMVKSLRKIPVNDDCFYLLQNEKRFRIVETPN